MRSIRLRVTKKAQYIPNLFLHELKAATNAQIDELRYLQKYLFFEIMFLGKFYGYRLREKEPKPK